MLEKTLIFWISHESVMFFLSIRYIHSKHMLMITLRYFRQQNSGTMLSFILDKCRGPYKPE